MQSFKNPTTNYSFLDINSLEERQRYRVRKLSKDSHDFSPENHTPREAEIMRLQMYAGGVNNEKFSTLLRRMERNSRDKSEILITLNENLEEETKLVARLEIISNITEFVKLCYEEEAILLSEARAIYYSIGGEDDFPIALGPEEVEDPVIIKRSDCDKISLYIDCDSDVDKPDDPVSAIALKKFDFRYVEFIKELTFLKITDPIELRRYNVRLFQHYMSPECLSNACLRKARIMQLQMYAGNVINDNFSKLYSRMYNFSEEMVEVLQILNENHGLENESLEKDRILREITEASEHLILTQATLLKDMQVIYYSIGGRDDYPIVLGGEIDEPPVFVSASDIQFIYLDKDSIDV